AALLGGSLTVWSHETSMVARSGVLATLAAPVTNAPKYFRIVVSDVDSDGDGVNDWEEYQLGLNPLNPFSNGQLDTNGQPVGDYAYVLGKLVSGNIVNLVASAPVATQPDPGQNAPALCSFTVTRGG